MTDNEQELFFQLCSFRNPDKKRMIELMNQNAATPEVLGFLCANRVAGIAYGVLKKSELLHLVDREFRNTLRNASVVNELWNRDYFQCVAMVSKLLEESGKNYALLKGAYLCAHFPAGYRTSNDIDVLVAPEDVGSISECLKNAGFEQGHLHNDEFVAATRKEIIESKILRGETVPFILRVDMPMMRFLEVDVNFSLGYKNEDNTFIRQMLETTELVDAGNCKIRTLSQIDFLLHLCAHLYKEATTLPWIKMKRDMTFYKYCDIYDLLWDFPSSRDSNLVYQAEQYGLDHILLYCIESLGSLMNRHEYGIWSLLYYRGSLVNLNEVISPAEKKKYSYKERNMRKRFFASDRVALLEEDEK